MDGPGQVVAHWLAAREHDRLDIFPVRLAGLRLYGVPDPEPEGYGCRVRVREVDDHRMVSDADLVRKAG